MKIKWYDNPYGLNEISQQTGFIFSFINEAFEQCHMWVKCRDYLHDAVRTQLTGKDSSVYGFNYGPSHKPYVPISLDKMRMLVSRQDSLETDDGSVMPQRDTKLMTHALMLLNHYEDMAGVELSTVEYIRQDGKNVWYFEGPKFWLKHPALVSMFTSLVRLGHKELDFSDEETLRKEYDKLVEEQRFEDNDAKYLASTKDKLHLVVSNAQKYLFPTNGDFSPQYYTGMDIDSFHNNCGILTFCQVDQRDSYYSGDRDLAKKVLELN